jgi:hypothetical protein
MTTKTKKFQDCSSEKKIENYLGRHKVNEAVAFLKAKDGRLARMMTHKSIATILWSGYIMKF